MHNWHFDLTDTSDAILLNTILASLPIPPVEENTKGENEPCSISLTLWPYTRLFSCLLYAVDNWAERFDGLWPLEGVGWLLGAAITQTTWETVLALNTSLYAGTVPAPSSFVADSRRPSYIRVYRRRPYTTLSQTNKGLRRPKECVAPTKKPQTNYATHLPF